MSEPGKTKFQIDLRRHLREHYINESLTHLICEIAEASKYIINSIRTGDLGVAGTSTCMVSSSWRLMFLLTAFCASVSTILALLPI